MITNASDIASRGVFGVRYPFSQLPTTKLYASLSTCGMCGSRAELVTSFEP